MMYNLIEKLAIDLIQFNKIDERSKKNKEKDRFMVMCFKIFMIALILSILYLFVGKCVCKINVEK